MKNIRKHLPLLALTFVLAFAAVLAVPKAAEAATSKSKSATLTVTDTKISGFKEITSTISFAGKSVIFIGTNSSGDYIYSYSTNGKKFSSAKKLKLTDITYTYNDKYLLIMGKNSKGENAYTYTTNGKSFSKVKKLGLTGTVDFESGNSGKSLYVLAKDNDTGTVTYDVGVE